MFDFVDNPGDIEGSWLRIDKWLWYFVRFEDGVHKVIIQDFY